MLCSKWSELMCLYEIFFYVTSIERSTSVQSFTSRRLHLLSASCDSPNLSLFFFYTSTLGIFRPRRPLTHTVIKLEWSETSRPAHSRSFQRTKRHHTFVIPRIIQRNHHLHRKARRIGANGSAGTRRSGSVFVSEINATGPFASAREINSASPFFLSVLRPPKCMR